MNVNTDQEQFKDIKEVKINRNSKRERKYSGQKKKNKKTNNDIQHPTHKTKD